MKKQRLIDAGKAVLVELRGMRAPWILAAVYLVLRLLFAHMSGGEGLISPTGVHLGVAVLGGAVLVLRITMLFGVPAIVSYRLLARFLPREPNERPGDLGARR